MSNDVRSFDKLREYHKKNYMLKSSKKIVKRTELSFSEKISIGLKYFIFSDNTNAENNFGYFGRNKIKVFSNYLNNELKVKKRKKFIDSNFKTELDNDKYILFPLQTEAESALLIESPLQNNQIEIIKKIAKSMPINYKLIVKEVIDMSFCNIK